jgi:hypothetical protein
MMGRAPTGMMPIGMLLQLVHVFAVRVGMSARGRCGVTDRRSAVAPGALRGAGQKRLL